MLGSTKRIRVRSKEQANDKTSEFVPLIIDCSHDGVVAIERPEVISLKVVSLKHAQKSVELMISPISISFNVFVGRKEEPSIKLSIDKTAEHAISKPNDEVIIDTKEQTKPSPIILTVEETLTEGRYVLEKVFSKQNMNSSKKYLLETLSSISILSELKKEENQQGKLDKQKSDEKIAPLQSYVIEKEIVTTRHSNLMLCPLELSIADSTASLPQLNELCDAQTLSEDTNFQW